MWILTAYSRVTGAVLYRITSEDIIDLVNTALTGSPEIRFVVEQLDDRALVTLAPTL